MIALFKSSNFILHWFSSVLAHIGSFFTIVALPWLVLGMTDNDPVLMSSVMAVITLPHSFFILFGGALVDRVSPLRVLFITRIVFVLVMLSLAGLIYAQTVEFWMLYLFAFALGTLGAFGIPAGQAFLPALVNKQQLPSANALMMGSLQVAQALGPLLAGWLIWWVRSLRGIESSVFDYQSIAIAFMVDGLCVLCAFIALLFMQVKFESTPKHKLMEMLMQGFRFSWHDKGVRLALMYLILISFFLHGVLMASLPIFTKVELGLAEASYGSLYAMVGLGTVIGAALAAIYVTDGRQLSLIMLICDLISGLCFFVFGHIFSFWISAALLLVMGICTGIIMVAGTTWFQLRTPGELMGRIMSILMFCVVGLVPLSAVLTGYLISIADVSIVIKAAGLFIILCAIVGLLVPHIRTMSQLPSLLPEVLESVVLKTKSQN